MKSNIVVLLLFYIDLYVYVYIRSLFMERIIVELMYWGVGVVFVDCKFFKSL